MKRIVLFSLLALVFIGFSSFKKKESKPVYVYGVAASFSDTLIYFTDIQKLDGVSLCKKGFLPQRSDYSYQLKNFMDSKLNLKDRVCSLFFSEDLKKLNKEYTKLLRKYKKNGGYGIRKLETDEFRFTPISVEPEIQE